jgi:tetratricopeptide (TPR) repeat protein
MATDRKTVMVSSTARDLPEHRKEVMDACLRQGMFPVMMEHLPASDDDAIRASLNMVDEADIYVGIFAHRYGYIPKGQTFSVTEMEYNRAVERKIPRCIFVMHEDHPIKAADVELGEGATKLKSFKERVQTENIVNFFKSPSDLRGYVIDSLSNFREADVTQFHYVSDIPQPPEAYIAHPYTLLQTHRLIGRQDELNLLTNWVTKKQEEIYWTRILSIVAIGGMGKSALTWKWFNDIAPQEMKPLAGRMWWSFYESDASFENFVIRALAYVSKRSREDIEKNTKPGEREEQLLQILDREPYLLVLDGLERILIAYARMDASRLQDSQVETNKNLRKTADPRVGSFFKKLTQIKTSRILVSTRLYPTELETDGGDSIPGSFKFEIKGLTDEDAVELWRASDVSGSRDELLPIFTKIDKHPLLIQALAGEIKRYHRAPGDFVAWQTANPQFDPTKIHHLQEAMGHVLEYALLGLEEKRQRVIYIIAAFRMPANYDTLHALLVGKDKTCENETMLDDVLTELEDRGLLGWDKRANRYDLHPIVRGVVWSRLSDDKQIDLFTSLQTHFRSLPSVTDWRQVNSLEELTSAIELYNTLVGLKRYEDAWNLYHQRLFSPLQFRLSMTIKQIEFLKSFFPNGLDKETNLSKRFSQSEVLRVLAESYHRGGQPNQAINFYLRCMGSPDTLASVESKIGSSVSEPNVLISHLQMLSDAYYLAGLIYQSFLVASLSLTLARKWSDNWNQAIILSRIGLVAAAIGRRRVSENALRRSFAMFHKMASQPREGGLSLLMAQLRIWLGDPATASKLANRAWELANSFNLERDFIRAARLQGTATLALEDFHKADERLHHALTRARAVNFIEEELPALVALAELRRRQKDLKAARELLDDVQEPAEHGPYPLFHADAFNVLAQIERDAGNNVAAVDAATKAYRLAWCDGEPYAYHWGLVAARKHLKELGAPELSMPPFDESKYEPMPEVEVNPKDEFWVDLDKDFGVDDLKKGERHL